MTEGPRCMHGCLGHREFGKFENADITTLQLSDVLSGGYSLKLETLRWDWPALHCYYPEEQNRNP